MAPQAQSHHEDDVLSPISRRGSLSRPPSADGISRSGIPNTLVVPEIELSQQISELRATVEAQGALVRRLLDTVVQSKGKEREDDLTNPFRS